MKQKVVNIWIFVKNHIVNILAVDCVNVYVCVCICHRHEFSALFLCVPIEKERDSMRLRTIRTNKLKCVYTFIISDRVQCTIAYNI